ncbi:hypothetical protein [Streptomyces viridochromogenes]|uniref:hypothetical protein n=1 Tax=Streptomyces viridochromogenes TaxID=1938 RepID=UPI000AF34E3F|nr:hypothetical protein [Streptomyces viridochromogenes]
MSTDWFSYCITTPEQARSIVNSQILRHQENIHRFFNRHAMHDVNLYITGSLSRKEPSVSYQNGQYSLLSDVDLIAVIKDGDSAGHPIRYLEDHMNQIMPEVSTSLFSIRSTDLPTVTSLLGRDLWYALRQPIVQAYAVDTFPPPCVGQREKYEAFIHQLGSYLLYPENARPTGSALHFRSSRAVHEIKLTLEGLRCLIEASSGELLRYRDVYENRESHLVTAVLSPTEVYELFRRRELFDGSPSNSSIKTVMQRMVAVLFNIAPGTGQGAAVVNALTERLQRSSSIIDIYQLTVPMLLWMSDPLEGSQREAREAFIDGWRNLDPSQLFVGSAPYEDFIRASTKTNTLPESHFRHFLTEIRRDYYWNLRTFLFGYRRQLAYAGGDNHPVGHRDRIGD